MPSSPKTKSLLEEIKDSLCDLNKQIREELPKEVKKCSEKYRKIEKLTGEIDDLRKCKPKAS